MPKPKTVRDIEDYLNRLGDDGWEIVNLDFRELSSHREFVGVAKRPKDERPGPTEQVQVSG